MNSSSNCNDIGLLLEWNTYFGKNLPKQKYSQFRAIQEYLYLVSKQHTDYLQRPVIMTITCVLWAPLCTDINYQRCVLTNTFNNWLLQKLDHQKAETQNNPTTVVWLYVWHLQSFLSEKTLEMSSISSFDGIFITLLMHKFRAWGSGRWCLDF